MSGTLEPIYLILGDDEHETTELANEFEQVVDEELRPFNIERFDGVDAPADVVRELGTCLRVIECEQATERALSDAAVEGAYQAWELARQNIWEDWDHFTDPSNLQPRVRKLNREIDDFLQSNPLPGRDQRDSDQVSDTLMSPWPMREENKLRIVWKTEHQSDAGKALALIKAVEETGIEPFEQPERFPKVDIDEVQLVCWLAIVAGPS